MDDVPLLAQQFLDAICRSEGEKKSFSEAALARLMQRRWPGNVRELRNVVHRAYVMAAGPVITDEWLAENAERGDAGSGARAAQNGGLNGALNGASNADAHHGSRAESNDAEPGRDGSPGGSITFRIGASLAEVERSLILATLKHYDNHREKTAEALGISLKTLYNRLKEYADPADGEPDRPN
jgi:DNA-binding NtrC family response regulator